MLSNTEEKGSPWAISAEDALRSLNTRTEGLSNEEAEERRRESGGNEIPKNGGTSALAIFSRQFSSPLIFILVAAAGIAGALREWIDVVVIVLAVFVNAGLGFYQEYRAERVLEKLSTYIREMTRVFRNGSEREVESAELVPGDIVHLTYGARVPADARIIRENGMSVDESILTGESLPVRKQTGALSEASALPDRTNMVFAGTLVIEGGGSAAVTATGVQTELGKIARLVSGQKREETPLQKSLAQFGWLIFTGISLLVAILFAIGISRGESPLEMLLIAAAVAVGAVPEALPIALTVILALGVERLAKKKGVMRSLSAAETLGSATVIMTDKTGTLTQADMTLAGIMLKAELAEGAGKAASGVLSAEKKELLENAAWATYSILENPDDAPATWRFIGRALEVNVAKAAHAAGIGMADIIAARGAPLLPFNSSRKFTVGARGDGERVVIGAPDILLASADLSKDEYRAILASVHALSEDGARLLGVARPKKAHSAGASPEDIGGLTFLGVLMFRDPVRPEAKEAMKRIEDLGARTVMVTGDLPGTARAVARELGWSIDAGGVLSGDEVRALSDDALSAALSHVRIFARVTPEDKMRIALLFQKQGEVVAMTGDGVNDAPSLKAVDIGVALGSGSDVAKGVADLVLLDDNFKTIVSAIEEGRRILGNIRKTFVYLVSTGLNEVFLIGGALLAGLPLPLTALQIIWVNIVTEGLPAVAYAFDEHIDDGKKAGRKHNGIFTGEVRWLTVGVGLLTSFLLFAVYWLMLNNGVTVEDARSVLFICFASFLLIAAFSLRSLRKPLFSYPTFSNRFLNISVLIGLAAVIASVTVPGLREIFDISVPPVSLLWIVAVWLVGNIAVLEGAKWFFRKRFA
jgi:P-type Ca2+ transporter type 2C